MCSNSLFIVFASSIFSGLVGVFISTYYYRKYEERKYKIDTFKRFFAYRFDLEGDEFSRAINEIFVVFNKSKGVIKALELFHKKIIEEQPSNDELLKLHKEMCIALKISYEYLNDSFFMRPFNARSSNTKANK